jgi:hypothetical protein
MSPSMKPIRLVRALVRNGFVSRLRQYLHMPLQAVCVVHGAKLSAVSPLTELHYVFGSLLFGTIPNKFKQF